MKSMNSIKKIYIIEDDHVWHLLYEKLFSKTEYKIKIFESFESYVDEEKEEHFLISDYFVMGEEVEDWLHIFKNQKGIIVSNAMPSPKIESSNVKMLPKPLDLTELDKYIGIEVLNFSKVREVTILSDFCDTDKELNGMIEILLKNLRSAIKDLESGAESIKKKYFYHNLINQMRYYRESNTEINRLYQYEEQVVQGESLTSLQIRDLIKMLNHYSDLLFNNT